MTSLQSQDIVSRPDLRGLGSTVRRLGALIALIATSVFFAIATPGFLQPANLLNILDHSTVLLIVALAMTTVIAAGGIDLSVGISLDLGAMVAVSLLHNGGPWPAAVALGLLAGLTVGAFNSLLIVKIGIGPFLATLGVMFIGQSIQRIYTQGGEPIYMMRMPQEYLFIGRGSLFGIPFKFIIAAVVLLVFYLLIERTLHGKRLRSVGLQKPAARIAGVRVDLYAALAYIISGLTCGIAGLVLSSSLSSYVPVSGGFYLIDAIGATFIGATIDPEDRPNVLGTLLGVLFFGIVTNGLNLLGLNFYWRTVAKGVLIFLALGLGALKRRGRTN